MTEVEVNAAQLRISPQLVWLPVSKKNLEFLRNVELLV